MKLFNDNFKKTDMNNFLNRKKYSSGGGDDSIDIRIYENKIENRINFASGGSGRFPTH